MDCTDSKRWFSPYVDELLTSQQRAEFEAHLKTCARCRTALESLRQMLRVLRTMEQPASPELLPGIHEQLLREPWWQIAARRFVSPWPQSLPLHSFALATTALLIVMVIALPQSAKRRGFHGDYLQLASAPADRRASYQNVQSRLNENAAVRRQVNPLIHRGKELDNGRLGVVSNESSTEARYKEAQVLDFEKAEGQGETFRRIAGLPQETREGTGSTSELAASNMPASTMVPKKPGKLDDTEFGVETLTGAINQLTANQTVGADGVLLAKTNPEESKTAEGPEVLIAPLQVQWRVRDSQAALAKLSEWVAARGGAVVAIDQQHCSIRLPASSVSALLEFLSATVPPAVQAPAPSSLLAPWVTISLELVPAR